MDILPFTVYCLKLLLTLGARPLNRLVQTAILEPLAMELIDGGVRSNERVKVRVKGGNLMVQRNHDPTDDANDLIPPKTEEMWNSET
jgi:C-terminal, D2-small domain, of ClpB protein